MNDIYAKYISAIERTTRLSANDYGAVKLALQMAIGDTQEAIKAATTETVTVSVDDYTRCEFELSQVQEALTCRDETITAMQKVIAEKDTEIALLNSRIEKLRSDLATRAQTFTTGQLAMTPVERRAGRPSYTPEERADLRARTVQRMREMLAEGKTLSQKDFERENPHLPRTNALVITLNCKWNDLVAEAGGIPQLSIKQRIDRSRATANGNASVVAELDQDAGIDQEAQPVSGVPFRTISVDELIRCAP